MKRSFGYYLLIILTWPMQLFPLEFHFIVSDFLYLIVYRFFGYRKKVVRKNLSNSFPQKTAEERLKIEQKFYHHFCDLFIEVLYLTHVSEKRHRKRMTYENTELLDELYEQGKNVIVVLGHYGNWDFSVLVAKIIKHPVYAIYKKMSNRAFDEFYLKVRGKDGIELLEMAESYRQLYHDTKQNERYLAFLIADQRPRLKDTKLWVDFMNQDTPVIIGPERIARKMNNAVVWSDIKKVKRGHYKHVFKLITDNPGATEEFEISKHCMIELEKTIQEQPEFWLWSHNRWKHKRPKN